MPMSQVEALAVLADGQSRLDALLGRLTDEQFEAPATIGGGEWSARDLLAHIALWEELAVEAAAEWRLGRTPSIETVFREERVDEVNAANATRSAGQAPEEVRARARRAHEALVALVRDMPEEEWRQKAAYGAPRRERLGTLLASITGAPQRGFGHAFAHLPDLEDYVARLGLEEESARSG